MLLVTCAGCGAFVEKAAYEVRRAKRNFCSMDCWRATVGKHVVIEVDGHRFYRQVSGYYRSFKLECSLHRYVWEKANGRAVPAGHAVHHIDGNRDNNDPANLTVLTNVEHGKLHGRPKGTGKGRAPCSAPGCDGLTYGRGLCLKHWRMVRRLEQGYPPRKWRTADRAADRHFQEVIAPTLVGQVVFSNPASRARWGPHFEAQGGSLPAADRVPAAVARGLARHGGHGSRPEAGL